MSNAESNDKIFESGNQESRKGISEIEGKAGRVAASESGRRTSFNRGTGISETEGKGAMGGAERAPAASEFQIKMGRGFPGFLLFLI
jgi:hypothetical protein